MKVMDFQVLLLDRGKELETSLLTFHVIVLVYPLMTLRINVS